MSRRDIPLIILNSMTLKQRDQFFNKRLPVMVRNLLGNVLHNLRHPGMRDGKGGISVLPRVEKTR